MRILISNDDGYLSPGIEALAQCVADFADEVIVVAPEQDRSGASSSLTLDRPLAVTSVRPNWYFVNGTPTDCVHIALTGLFAHQPPDLVLSGINRGANMGDDTIYSGTVAAAIEGHLFDIPAIAFSLTSKNQTHLPSAARTARKVVEWFWENRQTWQQANRASLLNVNIPDCADVDLKGWQITRLGKRHKAEGVQATQNPQGQTVYWIGAAGQAQDAGEGTDFYANAHRTISITPLTVDLTHVEALSHFRQILR